jgi:hypothetical protein
MSNLSKYKIDPNLGDKLDSFMKRKQSNDVNQLVDESDDYQKETGIEKKHKAP